MGEASFPAIHCRAPDPQHNTMIIGIPSLSTAAALFLAVLVDASYSPTGAYNASRDSNFAPWGKIKNMVVFGDR